MKKRIPWLFLVLITLGLSLAFALSGLRDQLLFGYDQARDAFEAYAIWHNLDLKILGPSTDIPGVFHGVLWYYFLAVVYFLGRNVSLSVLISLIFFYFSVPLLGLLTQKLFKDFKITCLAISLFVLSPIFQVFGRWLSNTTLALVIAPALLLFLWRYLSFPSRLNAFLGGAFFGALIQTNFAYAVMLLVLPIYAWYFKLKLRLSHAIVFGVGFLISVSSYILADIRFNGRTISAMTNFLLQGGSNPSASNVTLTLYDRLFEILSVTVLPWPKLAAIIFLLIIANRIRRTKLKVAIKPVAFVLIWLFGFVIMQIVSSAVIGSFHIHAAFIFPITILFAYFLFHSRLGIIVILIVFSQILTLYRWNKLSYSPISVQRGMYLSSEEKMVDYTYKESGGQPFIIKSVTNPLYINTLWAFLYQFYGLPKYGYLPFWGGRDQAGLLGNLPQKPFGENRRYLIIEDLAGIEPFYLVKEVYEEDKVSDLIEEKSFGNLKVQKRVFHPDKGEILMPKILKDAANLL